MNPAPGWYPDPADEAGLRWWDGEHWTQHQAARPDTTPEPVAAAGPATTSPVPVWQPQPVAAAAAPAARTVPVWQPEPSAAATRPGPSPASTVHAAQAYGAGGVTQPYAATPGAWAPAPKRMSTSTKILIGLGIALGGFVLLGILAAIAIPVFLNQRQQAELGALDCTQIAVEAAALSQQEAGTDLIALVELENPVLVRDERGSVRTPPPGEEAYVMTCEGDGVWADGITSRTWVDVYLNSDREPVLALGWDE